MKTETTEGKEIEIIIWEDSNMYITQTHISEDWKTCWVESVGYSIEETKEYIVLVGDMIFSDEVRRIIVIPKNSIKSRRKLK